MDEIKYAVRAERRAKGAEQRRERRARADRSYFVGCEVVDPDARGAEAGVALRLVDISPRGACLVTRRRLRPGQRVRVLVVRPGAGTRSSVDATVRWCESADGAHVTGVEFDRVPMGLGLAESDAPRPSKPVAPSREPRRHHRRFKPAKCELVCAPHEGLLRKIGIKTNAGLRVVDLSLGGAQIVCDRRIERGRKVDLEIYLEGGKRVIVAEARVGWCRRDTLSLKARWNVGVRFERLGPDARRALEEAQPSVS